MAPSELHKSLLFVLESCWGVGFGSWIPGTQALDNFSRKKNEIIKGKNKEQNFYDKILPIILQGFTKLNISVRRLWITLFVFIKKKFLIHISKEIGYCNHALRNN